VDIIGWRVDEVVKLIKGPKGTKVRLLFYPATTGVVGPSVEITLVRDKIKLEDQQAKKSVINYNLDGTQMKLGVIMLPSFYMDFEAHQKGDPNYNSTTRDVKRLIQELKIEKVDGIVLDLRDNGGGSLAEAVDLTGLFIKDGPVVQVKDSSNKINVLDDDDPSIVYSGPLVVLTNRFSASASEIFAGAIQDYRRGVVVGESTHGKGTVQTIVDLGRFMNRPETEVGKVKLTFQKFYRINGSSTQLKGVTPDVLLPTPYAPDQYGEGSYENAMPWDEIRSTLYQRTPVITDKVLTDINRSYQDRLKKDAALARFVVETEEFRESLQDRRVSLNETTRRKEMEEAAKRKDDSPLNTTIRTKDDVVISDLTDLDDEYLREGAIILAELITRKIG
jgi:carboxyl-terminal processing protease